MKKSSWYFIFIFSVLIVSLGVVSAAETASAFGSISGLVNSVIDSFVSVINPLAKTIVGTSETGEIFFGRLLMLVVVFSLVLVVLGRLAFFDEHGWAPWVISGALAIVSVRFLSAEWITTVVLPNQVLAVALTAGLPFILFFLIVKDFTSKTATRISWILFGVVFLALWSMRIQELGKIAYVYPIVALLALGMVIFDGTIRKWTAQIEMERLERASDTNAVAEIQTRINDVKTRMLPSDPSEPRAGTLSPREGNRLLKDYNKRLKKLLKG